MTMSAAKRFNVLDHWCLVFKPIGRSMSLTMRYDQEPVSHSCQTVPELPRNELVGEGNEDE